MRALPRRTRIAVGFAAALLVLAGAVGIAWRSMHRLIQGGQRVAHAQEVLAELRTTLSQLQDLELSVRGFVLTGEDAFLKLHRKASRRLPGQLDEIRWLTAGDVRQREWMRQLDTEVAAKLAWSDRMIAAREAVAPDRARAEAAMAEAARSMARIQSLLGRMEDEEDRYLFARPADAGSQLSHVLVVVSVGAFLPFLMLLAVYWAVQRETRGRTAAAESLRKQLSFTAAITESLGEGVYALDREGRLTLMNGAAQEMLGWTEKELLGRKMHEAIHFQAPDGTRIPEKLCPLVAVLNTGRKLHRDDEVFTRRDGTTFRVEFVSSPFLLDGRIVGAVVTFQDIAERKKTEAELLERAHQALFGAAVGAALTKAETLPKALGQCAEEMVRHLDAAMASIWTLSKTENVLELQGSAWLRRPLFGPDARVPVGEFRVGEIARTRKPALLDLTTATEREDDKDWAQREGMVAFAGYPLIVEERLVGVMAMFATRPLTDAALTALASVADEIALGIDRAQAAEALRSSESRTRSVVDNMLEGLVLVDENSIVRGINPAAERIFGYRADELVGGPLSTLVPESASLEPLMFLKDASRRALGRVTQWEGRRKNGEVFPFELSLFEFRTPEGRRFGGSVRDVSESREVERLKKEFVSTVSHELRTPLTSIRGSLGLLAGGVLGDLSPEAGEVVGIAERNVERLVRLINDILDLERYDTGRIEMRFESIELGALFARSLEAVRHFAVEEGVLLESSAAVSRVWGDGDRLVQVLVNLLSNAVKFSPRGSLVRLTAGAEDGWTEIRVSDRGRGVPAHLRQAIFERFRQVEASDSRQKGGSGLGLAICKAIVEQHGGSIGVESAEGKGSVFWFRIPPAPAEARATLPCVPEAARAAVRTGDPAGDAGGA